MNWDTAIEGVRKAWHQGNFDGRDGSHCALGWMAKARSMNIMDYDEACNRLPEVQALADVIVENYGIEDGLRFWHTQKRPGRVVVQFNDHVAKSAEDVAAMMEKAAANLTEGA